METGHLGEAGHPVVKHVAMANRPVHDRVQTPLQSTVGPTAQGRQAKGVVVMYGFVKVKL